MFTGLVRRVGVIKSFRHEGKGLYIVIDVDSNFLNKLNPGASIAVDGICLTVTELQNRSFSAFVMNETVKITTLNDIASLKGRHVNLENSMQIDDGLDGHLVYGHIDFVTTVTSIYMEGYSRIVGFKIPSEKRKYFVKKGSVAINGVSLTIKSIDISSFSVSLIPETIERTNLTLLRVGNKVNIETDIIGKYIENFIRGKYV
ncbi:riboflavin synthase [candidate division TA06 bacterium]|uniref:Riboflavin synthase n=1 Tax=candidate division TA06 bacterium TaxID=2250710 RepID=A0A660SPR6_UNCT6|nr:MAG: riboflavin synthase [candidate division TA06 bacterium]